MGSEKVNETVETRIRTMLSSEDFGIDFDEITGKSHLIDDLGLDSIDFVEFIMLVEAEYKLEIPDDEFEDIETVNALCAYIERRRKS